MHKFPRLFLSLIAFTLITACSDGSDGVVIERVFSQATVDLPSVATPAYTPGTPGVVVSNEKMIKQFGGADINLNKARYTRYFLSDKDGQQPDAIVVLVPGTTPLSGLWVVRIRTSPIWTTFR